MRLLPRNPHVAWTPYAWLIYLPIFLFEPLDRGASALEWAATLGAMAVFLALYFVGYWVEGGRLLLVMAAIFALGAGFAPWNANSSVFVVYASAFAGRLPPPRRAMGIVAGMIALAGIEAWALRLAPSFWITAAVFSLVVGGVNVHFSELGRTGARLKESQAQVQQLVRIAERERIARDLHDLLGHTLSVITLKAELAGKLLAISPERAAAEIREVERVSRDALREVRSAVAGYRSEGLPAELARARLALEAAGVRPEYFTLPVTLPADAEAALALAVREAVTNVIRHAGAAACRITLERRGDAVVLEVADDGRGGARGEGGTGTGLRAMRERLAGLGGQLEIQSGPAAGEAAPGTRLLVTVPLRAEGRAGGIGAAATGGAAATSGAAAGAGRERQQPTASDDAVVRAGEAAGAPPAEPLVTAGAALGAGSWRQGR
jgi:two-component system sensor histidine kinase DesK